MQRISPVVLSAAAGFVTLLALPATRWVVLNHIDFLRGNMKVDTGFGYRDGFLSGAYVLADASKPEKWHPVDQFGELGKAYEQVARYGSSYRLSSDQARFKTLRTYCAGHPEDAVARAAYGCYASGGLIGAIRWFEGERAEKPDMQRAQSAANEVLHAIDGAERAEPDNVLFPFLESAAYRVLGRDREAVEAFDRASTKQFYDPHCYDICRARWHAFEATKGYRGQTVRILDLSDYGLPQNSLMRSMAKWVVDREGAKGRVEVMKLSGTMISRSSLLIDMLTGKSLATTALREPGEKTPAERAWTITELREHANRWDRDAGSNGYSFAAFVNRFEPVLADQPEFGFQGKNDATSILQAPRAVSGATALTLAAGSFAFSLLGWLSWLKARFPRFAAGAPQLSWALIVLLPPAVGTGLEWVGIAVAGLILFVCSLLVPEKWRVHVRIAGYGVAAVSLLFSFADWPIASSVFITYVLADLMTQWSPNKEIAKGFIAVAAGLVLIGTVFAALVAIGGHTSISWLWIVAVVVVATLPRILVWPKWAAPGLLALACLAYLFCIGWELRDDRTLERMVDVWMHQADTYRREVGMPALEGRQDEGAVSRS